MPETAEGSCNPTAFSSTWLDTTNHPQHSALDMSTHNERSGVAGLRIETSFRRKSWEDERHRSAEDGDGIKSDRINISCDYNARRRDTDEDRSMLNDWHSTTSPISVPRSEGRPMDDDDYSHSPDEVQESPFNNYIQARRPSISFNPKVSIDDGHEHSLERSLERPPLKFESRTSGLRNALSQDDESFPNQWEWNSKRSHHERGIPTGCSRVRSMVSPMNESIEGPTSLTSLSTASPLVDEVRTPPGSNKDDMLSPLYFTSPSHQFSSPIERSASWSGDAFTMYGSKPRCSTMDRSSSLRHPMRSSRRSTTTSSGKSPASMFLSMWSTPSHNEEPVTQPDEEGQMVGTEYVLGKQIGFGGFSVIKEAFKVEEQGQAKRLAVKIVKKQLKGRSETENESVQAEFDHEVRVWRYLNHPHILTLDSVHETDYATFCFTKLAIGGSLFDLVRQNRQGLDPALAKKYSYQLASAIRYLHEDARIIHRDIKLENCLLDPVTQPDGTVSSTLVLCDFGMSEWMVTESGDDDIDPYDKAADRPPLKQMGPADSSTSVAGSLEYASPELLKSTNGLINPSVDVWAFGVIVYAVIVGSRPFQDSFTPRVQAKIMAGEWNRNAIIGDVKDKSIRRDRQDALELIEGCLEMDVRKRWTIREILDCAWLREIAAIHEESSPESAWSI